MLGDEFMENVIAVMQRYELKYVLSLEQVNYLKEVLKHRRTIAVTPMLLFDIQNDLNIAGNNHPRLSIFFERN